jgi:hypothetical protein
MVMYQRGLTTIGAGVGISALPYTGLDVLWLLIGAFALVMAGGALLRTLPKWKR